MAMEKRQFGATGKAVSLLGIGTAKFGRNTHVKYPGGDGFELPSDARISDILDMAIDHGVNLIDTAPAYGTAETRLGEIMGSRRDRFFINTKAGEEYDGEKSTYVFDAGHIRQSVERSLKRLHTDYLDCVMLHCSRNDVAEVVESDALETLARLKQEGKILSFGASTNSVEAGRYAADHADAVMVSYNAHYQDEAEVIAYAHVKNCAVLIKKGLASGHTDKIGDTASALRFVANTKGVTSIVIGSITPANILFNINVLSNG